MHPKTKAALLGYGLTTELIAKIGANKHSIAELRALAREKLLQHFTSEEVEEIKARIDRNPIPEAIISELVSQSAQVCCYCADGNSARPFQIHHIDPYSETQNNSINNLLLVCPNHHVWIHESSVSRELQRSQRRRWSAETQLAADFEKKGIPFPFGTFRALDFLHPPNSKELVRLEPLSPATALLSYSHELARTAEQDLNKRSFLLVSGASGSGKSTYALALAGRIQNQNSEVFRYAFNKQRSEPLKEIFQFISSCVRNTVLIVDDANQWASARDVQEIAKAVAGQKNLRIILVWSSDDSDDEGRLRGADLAQHYLTWSDLRAAVVDALLTHEGDIVEELRVHEQDFGFGSLGVGSLNTPLHERIRSLGDRPQTVYEFILGLRGNQTALDRELRELVDDGRSDIPILFVAIEQIAGFEKAVSVNDAITACKRVETGFRKELPEAAEPWVQRVLEKQRRNRRLVAARDLYTTIHRNWAARLIGAGLTFEATKQTTEALLSPDFDLRTTEIERLIRLWSWLRSVESARHYVRKWENSLSRDDWAFLVARAAKTGLQNLGYIARQMHLLFKGNEWTRTVAHAFESNYNLIASAAYSLVPSEWYHIRQVAMVMEHACPVSWAKLIRGWDKASLAGILHTTPLVHLDDFWSTFEKARTLCPEWPSDMAAYVSWDSIFVKLQTAQPGDLSSIFEGYGVFHFLHKKRPRSTFRILANLTSVVLRDATLENLRVPLMDGNLTLLAMAFPGDAERAFNSINTQTIAENLEIGLPRHWRKLSEFASLCEICSCDVPRRIVQLTDPAKLARMINKYGPESRYELRLLLHFFRYARVPSDSRLLNEIRTTIVKAVTTGGSEGRDVLKACHRLSPDLAASISREAEIEFTIDAQTGSLADLSKYSAIFAEHDKSGIDYDIDVIEAVAEARSEHLDRVFNS
jgi:energy-coupling factor transporter ATP-binding protein EcfA2